LVQSSITDVDVKFDEAIESKTMNGLAHANIREEARDTFRDEWERVTCDGIVKEVDLVWVVVA